MSIECLLMLLRFILYLAHRHWDRKRLYSVRLCILDLYNSDMDFNG